MNFEELKELSREEFFDKCKEWFFSENEEVDHGYYRLMGMAYDLLQRCSSQEEVNRFLDTYKEIVENMFSINSIKNILGGKDNGNQ